MACRGEARCCGGFASEGSGHNRPRRRMPQNRRPAATGWPHRAHPTGPVPPVENTCEAGARRGHSEGTATPRPALLSWLGSPPPQCLTEGDTKPKPQVANQRSSRTRREAPMTTTTDRARRHPTRASGLTAAGLALGLGLTGCTAGTHPVASITPMPTTSARGTTPAPAVGAPTTITAADSGIVLAGRHFKARCDGSGPAVIGANGEYLTLKRTPCREAHMPRSSLGGGNCRTSAVEDSELRVHEAPDHVIRQR